MIKPGPTACKTCPQPGELLSSPLGLRCSTGIQIGVSLQKFPPGLQKMLLPLDSMVFI